MSSEIISSPLTRDILEESAHLSLKKGFMVFQNVLLSVILFISKLE